MHGHMVVRLVCLTSAWPTVDVDGLGGVVAVIILYSNQVGISLRAEVGAQGQHMVIAVAQGLGYLSTFNVRLSYCLLFLDLKFHLY